MRQIFGEYPTESYISGEAIPPDMRTGFNSLAAKVETALAEVPFSGHVFMFRGRRGDMIKLLRWTGDAIR